MAIAILWQRIEGLIIFVMGLGLFWHWNDTTPWWTVLLIFFAPDLTFGGYVFGPKVGALCYNAVHIYAFGVASLAVGVTMSIPLLQIAGALWLAHSGFDRMFGYGLKSQESFSLTHLGRLGR